MFIRILAVAIFPLMLAAMPAQAAVMIYWDTHELTDRSTAVILAEVTQQQEVFVEKRLWTDSYVRVIESIKGNAKKGEVLTVRQPGGETVVIGSRVPGAAQFSLGEKVLLFLRPVDHYHVVVGMSLGKYHIFSDPSGKQRVYRDLKGIAFAGFDEKGRFRMEDWHEIDSRASHLALDELVRAIQARLKDGGAR